MRKTLLYLVLLSILGFGVYYFLFNNRENAFNTEEADFTVKDTASIGKIFIADRTGNTILVERTDTAWVLNKKYKALNSTLKMVFSTLYRQKAVSPINKSARNNVIKQLATDATKVELYDRQGKKMKVFYVGGQANEDNGTLMLLDGADKPYVVQITGEAAYLTSRYPVDVASWRDKTVFNVTPDKIKSISIQYPGHEVNSFTLNQDGNNTFTISANPEIMAGKQLNQRRTRVYAKYFTGLNCEGYLNGKTDMDTAIKIYRKRCDIDLVTTNGAQQHVDVYWMPINKRSKNISTSAADIPDQYDADRYYAIFNDFKDTAIIQTYSFGKLFRPAYEFFEADPESTGQPANTGRKATNVMISKPGNTIPVKK